MGDRYAVKMNEVATSRIKWLFIRQAATDTTYTIIDTITGHEIHNCNVPQYNRECVEKLCKKLNITFEAPEFRVFVDGNKDYWLYRKTHDAFGGAEEVFAYSAKDGSYQIHDPDFVTDKTCADNPYSVAYYKCKRNERKKAYKTLEEAEKAIEQIHKDRELYYKSRKLKCVK